MPGSKSEGALLRSFRASEGRAMFDVKPVNDSGSIDVARMAAVQAVVNLATLKRKHKLTTYDQQPMTPISKQRKKPIQQTAVIQKPSDVKEEFESALNEATDLQIELAKFGQAHQMNGKPRYRPILPTRITNQESRIKNHELAELPTEFESILTEIHQSRAAAAREPEITAMVALGRPIRSSGAASYDEHPATKFMSAKLVRSFRHSISVRTKKLFSKRAWFIAAAVAIGLIVLAAGGWGLKRHITAQGSSAVANLENAKADLAKLNFENASQDFVQAYQNFSKAGEGLNFMGATIGNLLAALPGGGTVKSAQNLIQVGKLLSDAGAAMTQAVKALADAGTLFTPGDTSDPSLVSVMSKLQKALAIASADVTDIRALIADTDPSIIPAEKRDAFEQLSALVPTIEQVVGHGADYAKFFADAAGQPGTHRYLVLFENSSELRPTGGFPGSYGVVTFKDGRLEDFMVDDVYNLDGQIKQPVVPPVPLQHITPDWGMRDANWFADFPTSARVIEDFYKKESGQSVDGVITINPSLVTDILKITGPVPMPQYGLILSADNFVTTIQNQIEYVADRTQPKQVIKDFAPLLMAKLRTASSDQWLAIFNSVISNMDKRAVLMYFNNLTLETFADDQGFSGQVYRGDGDYVMPVISNVKGSKTDAVTNTSFTMDTKFEDTDAVHTLTITRTHNGGNDKYAFYNKQNPAYIRVLVPANAELVSIDGNDSPSFQPLLDYAKAGFANNDTLVKFESSGMEAGKKEFGFWLITDPSKTKTVTVTYKVPNVAKDGKYNLYFQKQPGLVVKNLNLTADSYSYNAPLEKDLSINVQLP